MSERFSFVDRHLVDGSVVWNQDNIDGVHSVLSDTMDETYATAEEDSPTRYLSVLDSTNEISLDNLNISLANPKLEVEETVVDFITEDMLDQDPEELSDQQVVVFTVEGSDELYGIQVAQDEDGNLQKYQFQFRKNEDGQLEAIPETIQLLPMEEEGINVENLAQPTENENTESVQIFVQEDNSGEHILPDLEEQAEESTLMYESEVEEDTVDVKPGILALQNVKQEMQEEQPVEYETQEEEEETINENLEQQEFGNFHESEEVQQETTEEQENLMEYHDHVEENMIQPQEGESTLSRDVIDSIPQSVVNQEFEHVEVSPDLEIPQTDQNFENQDDFTNDSDENDYQIVEGLHITGDVENSENSEPIVEKQTSFNNTNILKHVSKANKEKVKKDNKLYLYVVQHPEKENVDSLSLEMSNLCRPKVPPNPRSILKSSHAMLQAKNEMESTIVQDERFNKRFSRCKEAMQAKIFNNFINKTTIPQAPVRKNRLPRKQKIKPVERMDEEIVVQEVMVSSNGFVETVRGGINKENLAVTEYVELTDSDDDYDPKRINRKKKKHRRKRIEITISDDDTDVSNDSVIDLMESDDEIGKKGAESPPKRRRGRPPKNKPPSDTAKKSRLETMENPTKPEIPCPKCAKTFPSQNSLKTHLQHHNLQSSIKNALPEYKYKCENCAVTFKNNILLGRHKCPQTFNCSVCKKKFSDLPSLNTHKRIHAKEQLVKSTTTVQMSPKKIKTFKSPPKIGNFKCRSCAKLCSSLQTLNVHQKTHKEHVCATCSATFVSQLLLEKHVRESCVKSPQGHRRLTRTKSLENAKKLSMSCTKVKCDKCQGHFVSHQALFKHKVLKHGLETPDKSVLEKDEEDNEKKGATGVPAARKLKNVYTGLNCQLDFSD